MDNGDQFTAIASDVTDLSINFRGGRARTGLLTWGQRDVWEMNEYLGPDDYRINNVFDVSVAAGVTLDAIRSALRLVFERHESLRTWFFVGADGQPYQKVKPSGEITALVRRLAVVDAAAVDSMRAELYRPRFDTEGGFLVRVVVLADAVQPRSVIFATSHLLCDAHASGVLREEIRKAMDSTQAHCGLGDPGVQPLDQLEFELSEKGRRLNERSLRYWRSQLAEFPAGLFPEVIENQTAPRYRAAVYDTVAVAMAADSLALRHRVSASAAVTAAFSLALGCAAGATRFALDLVSSYRSRPWTQDSVGQFAYRAPVVIEVSHDTFATLFKEAQERLITAYRHSLCSPDDVSELIREMAEAHGDIDGARCLMNPIIWSRPIHEEVDPAELRRQARASRFTWGGGEERERISAYIQASPRSLLFFADSRRFSAGFVEALLPAVERILIEAVDDAGMPPYKVAAGALGMG